MGQEKAFSHALGRRTFWYLHFGLLDPRTIRDYISPKQHSARPPRLRPPVRRIPRVSEGHVLPFLGIVLFESQLTVFPT